MTSAAASDMRQSQRGPAARRGPGIAAPTPVRSSRPSSIRPGKRNRDRARRVHGQCRRPCRRSRSGSASDRSCRGCADRSSRHGGWRQGAAAPGARWRARRRASHGGAPGVDRPPVPPRVQRTRDGPKAPCGPAAPQDVPVDSSRGDQPRAQRGAKRAMQGPR